MKKLLIAVLLLGLCGIAEAGSHASPRTATNHFVTAVQWVGGGTNWYISAFDNDWQLQRGSGTNKLTRTRMIALRQRINGMATMAEKRQAVRRACNRYLNRPVGWQPFPGWAALGVFTDIRIGMGKDIPTVVANITQ